MCPEDRRGFYVVRDKRESQKRGHGERKILIEEKVRIPECRRRE